MDVPSSLYLAACPVSGLMAAAMTPGNILVLCHGASLFVPLVGTPRVGVYVSVLGLVDVVVSGVLALLPSRWWFLASSSGVLLSWWTAIDALA